MSPQWSKYMKQRPVKHLSQSALLLLELIIATAYLALSSVVCIRLYLYAHNLSAASAAKTNAVREVQNLAEAWLSSDGSLSSAILLYQETADSQGNAFPDSADKAPQTAATAADAAVTETSVLYYDENWEILPSARDAAFCITLSLHESSTPDVTMLSLAAASVTGKNCYSLDVERYTRS